MYDDASVTGEYVTAAPDWTSASCATVDPKLWFPPINSGGAQQAKRICQSCPVRQVCLDWAITNHVIEGIWGGMSYSERLEVRRVAA